MFISLLERYNQLKSDYESYQKLAEETIQKQNKEIRELDKKLDMLSSIIEISQYINKCLGSDEIISKINDIMIGILGVNYSSVYLLENRKLKLKCTNLYNTDHHFKIREYNEHKLSKLTPCLANSVDNMCMGSDIQVHSSLFMPIYLKEELLGAILVEHNIYNYLNQGSIKLLSALSNQIAICIENNRLYNKIKENSQRDFLTNLFNRNYFFSAIQEKIKNCGRGFAIIMVDIDNFKNCNDTFGHQCGDMVLKRVSSIIKDNLRKEDMVARYGGEEIIIYMYDIKEMLDVYNRMSSIRKSIEREPVEYNGKLCFVTVSIGISISDNKDENIENVENVIRKADMNLYKAKNSGKNKVVY
ncbi:diguanylate cyclase [Clostridium sp. MT-14]|uniref:GGDEF domain-containing protein n=1 Tax=Clostridium aromativorans TaxID=2836848 RepID=A0ABS8N7H6_9CLOT|nr:MULTISPECIES: sensor domain-containing diguanylate cyclase [Clostridium]KAA8670510.1 GGDEF domain-containing protein [Clostridium sp. HV4-5-A1G]MCC9295040.1 GGDEF domain-containing protein [Clostridium aromativorans]